ncbi:hypothetical protein ABS198_21380, partial [Acinetobacter baumannii]|uniref:hypothetical protein n=1 Tax=Acinetobacter baumannii TaxID=470 RepID=UPI00332139E6
VWRRIACQRRPLEVGSVGACGRTSSEVRQRGARLVGNRQRLDNTGMAAVPQQLAPAPAEGAAG